MCYYISIIKSKIEIEKRFFVRLPEGISLTPTYKISAFDKKAKLLTIISGSPQRADFYHWGLIPYWIKTQNEAEGIRKKTVNARAETVFIKPSYKRVVLSKRALIIADGFFEWHNENGEKIPYYIKFKDGKLFAIAGIWDEWRNPVTKKLIKTVSILTYKANSLLEKVHNTKKRMPLILPERIEKKWLKKELDGKEIREFFKAYEYKDLIAYPVPKKIFLKSSGDNPELIKIESIP